MAVSEGDTIQVHYTGRLDNGEVFDSSVERGPLEFTVGDNQVVPGFESGVLGMEAGEKRTLTLAPEDAYGERDERLIRAVPRAEIDVPDLTEGHVLQLQSEQGHVFQGIVVDVGEEEVRLDFNHFLAGKTLEFDVELVGINDNA